MTMAAERGRDRRLNELLEQVVVAHRKDIMDYSGGHLNESKLHKPPEMATFKSWPSAHAGQLTMKQKHVLAKPKRGLKNKSEMEKAIMDFSVGTSGALPNPPPTRTHRTKGTPKKNRLKDIEHLVDGKTSLSPSQSPEAHKTPKNLKPVKKHRLKDIENFADGRVSESPPPQSEDSYDGLQTEPPVLVEELRLPDVMLPSPREPEKGRWESMDNENTDDDEEEDEARDESPRNLIPKHPPNTFKHRFISSHLGGVTKRDQYDRLKDFEKTVIRKQDAMEREVMSGQKAVEQLEQKLKEELATLPYDGYGPNFHRLQIYSNTLDDMIRESPTFAYVLRQIKGEYDNYLSTLLDSQTSQHNKLYEQIQQLSDRGTSKPKHLEADKSSVEFMESEAKKMLSLNESLRKEVQHELELAAAAPEPEPPKRIIPTFVGVQKQDLAEQVQDLHTSITEKLETINATRQHLHEKFVPSSVCNHLEQCVKETEIEIQKLMKQNEFCDKEIEEMENDFHEIIDDAELSERDIRRIWRKVNAVKAVDSAKSSNTASGWTSGPTPSRAQPGQEDSDDDEKETQRKWNWYIS